MKSLIGNTARLMLILGITIALVGCATTKKDWQSASHIGTIEAYEHFLQDHPDSDQAEIAHQRLAELRAAEEWSKAESRKTIDGYRNFLDKYPQSKQAKQANEQLELLQAEQDWEQAESAGTILAYKDFIKKHPTSKHISMAEQEIADQDWEETRSSKTSAAYSEFISKHPESQQVLEAREMLSYCRFLEHPTRGTLLYYFESFPDGKHVSEIVKIGQEKNIGLWIKEKNVMVVIEEFTSSDERRVPTNRIVNWDVVYENVPADADKTFAACILTIMNFSNPFSIGRNDIAFVSAEEHHFIPEDFTNLSERVRVVTMGLGGASEKSGPITLGRKTRIKLTSELPKEVMKDVSIEVFGRRMATQQTD